jgi:hypothetical protein
MTTALLEGLLEGLSPSALNTIGRWFERGDGVAVYENVDLGHSELGQRKYVSFGSETAQLETDDPPERLPDIGNAINWRYRLVGSYRRA